MAEKMFKIKENQKIWDKYFNRLLDEWKLENEERLLTLEYTEEEKEFYSKKTLELYHQKILLHTNMN